MKKFLSLVLALVMTMSLVTVSAGAEDFTDDSSITYEEAVDVMSAVKVIDGYTDGSFQPTTLLTRGAAAKIICNLILGPTTAAALGADTAPYSDVPTTNTFAGYIAYCQKEGIISGYADGTFKPAAPLTGYAFMKMLLGALGYDASKEGYTGANWSINVAKQAIAIGLEDGNDDFVGQASVNREEAMLYAFNAMNATMVEYGNDTTITVGDVTVSQSGNATAVANTASTETIENDNKMQFAEKYFSDLKKVAGDTDAFMRPATTWKLKSTTIGTYADKADATYTAAVKIGEIYSDLGLTKGIADEYTTVYEDGRLVDGLAHDAWTKYDIVKGQTAKIGGNGALTEVYYDTDDNSVIIVVTNTYVGKVAGVYAATSTKDAYVTLNTSAADKFTSPTGASGFSFETEGFSKDNIVAYTYSYKAGEACIESMELAESVTGAMSTYTTTGSVTVAGTKYDANTVSATNIAAFSGTVDKGSDVTVYLDAYGYGLYVDANVTAQYAVVVNYTATAGDFNTTPKAELLFTDGTTKTVEVALTASCGTPEFATLGDNYNKLSKYDIVSYSVDSDEVYTLTLVADSYVSDVASAKIVENGKNTINVATGDNANVIAAPYVYTDDVDGKTIFLVADTSKVATGGKVSYSVYEGFANVPTITNGAAGQGRAAVYAKDGSNTAAEVVFIERTANMTISSGNKDIIYVKGNASHSNVYPFTGRSYSTQYGDFYEYDAFINGEATTIKSESAITADTLVYGPHYNTKGVLNGADMAIDISTSASSDLRSGYGTDSVTNDVIKLGLGGGNTEATNVLTAYAYEKDVNVYYVTVDGELVQTTIDSIARDFNDRVYYKVNDDGRLTDVYVKVLDEAETVDPGTSKVYSGVLVKNAGNLDLKITTTDAGAPANWSGYTYTVYGKNTNTGYTTTVVATTAGSASSVSYTAVSSGVWTATMPSIAISTNNGWVYWATVTVNGETFTTGELAG